MNTEYDSYLDRLDYGLFYEPRAPKLTAFALYENHELRGVRMVSVIISEALQPACHRTPSLFLPALLALSTTPCPPPVIPIFHPASNCKRTRDVSQETGLYEQEKLPSSTNRLQSLLKDDSDGSNPPTVPNDPTLPNIMVLGPTGGGVSSVVNLIAGKDVARVSNDTSRCTKKMSSYRIRLVDGAKIVPITLYDIPGFEYNAKSPLEFPRVPISLAIICLEDFPAQVRATAEYLQNKWRKHGNGNVPVLVVINHIAPKPDPVWWEENQKHFPSLGVVTDHVCLTRRKKEESTKQLHSLIIQHLSAHKVHNRARAS